jgi:hypothetical protein
MNGMPELADLLERALTRTSAEDLWQLMLREDPVYRKIQVEMHGEAVSRAASFGRNAAADLAERLGTRDPAAIANALKVAVVNLEAPHVFGRTVRTSTYTQKTRTIALYSGAVTEMNNVLADADLFRVLVCRDVRPVYVAHELLHHLEEDGLGRAADLLHVVTFSLGPIRLRSGIGQMSEIAADAFAQTLLELPAPPRLLDYLTVCIHNPEMGRKRLAALADG